MNNEYRGTQWKSLGTLYSFIMLLGIVLIVLPTHAKAAEIAIPNSDFEDDLNNWLTEGDDEASSIEEGYESEYALKHSLDSSYEITTSQTLEGLENGYYTLTAWSKSSGGQNANYIFAEGTDISKAMTSLPASDDWTKTIIRGVHVTNGELTIGLYSDGNAENWSQVDLFKLEKTDEPYHLLKGGDVSEVTHVESLDGKYYDQNGVEKDVFQILKENGHDIVRLRLYNDPGKGRGDGEWYRQEGFMNKEDVLDLAKRAKNVGLQIQLTFHYSDYWSNGATQIIPQDWQKQIDGMSDNDAITKLTSLVYDYTKDIMQAMADQGTTPEYVSLGNEMQSGILYPYGRANDSTWENLAMFLNAGAKAVEEINPSTKIVLHLDGAGEYDKYNDFFEKADELKVNYHIIGSSYYPFWTSLKVNEVTQFFNDISEKFDKDIMVMEAGYNWNPTLPSGYAGQLTDNGPYPMSTSTPLGQKNFMNELFNGLKMVNNGRLVGVLYWDPIMIAQPGVGWAINETTDEVGDNVVSNTTLFDFKGKALKVLDAFKYNTEGTKVGHISGVVKGMDGNRIPNAEVSLSIGGQDYSIQADRNGNYLLADLPTGSNYTVKASKQGYIANSATANNVIAGKFTDLDIILTGGAVSGTVEDDSGNPTGDVKVSIIIDDVEYSTTTDESGNYRIGDLPEGSNYEIIASREGYKGDSQAGVSVEIGGTTSNVDLTISLSSGTITGRVIDNTGTPVEGATVSLDVEGKVFSGVTDDLGKYDIFNVPEGANYQVIASKDNFVDGKVIGIDVITGESTEIPDITLDSNVGIISGTVQDSKGDPVSGATVTATSGLNNYLVETNSLGEYELVDVLAGEYKVEAQMEGYLNGVETGVLVSAQETISDMDLRVADPIPVPNFSFENPGETWVISEGSATTMSGHAAVADGDLVLSSWAEGPYESNVYQTITDLDNGYYTLTALFYNGGGQNEYYMYAKDTGEEEVRVNIPSTGGMTPITLNVKVTNGQMTIGFYADARSGNWSLIDVVQLGYRGELENEDTSPEPGDGDETPEPGDGDETPEPGDGDETPEPGDGDETPESGDGDASLGSDDDRRLPSTFSNVYNWIFTGLILVIAVATFYFVRKSKVI